MKKRVLVILCSLVMILLVGCRGNASNSLVGQWVNEDANEEEKEGDPFDFFNNSTAIEFFSDGTAIISYISERTNSVKWVVENERLKITLETGIFGDIAASYSYKLSKDTLVLTDDDGEKITYTKVTGTSQVNNVENTINGSSNLVEIDPFEYISIEYDGKNYFGEVKEIHNNATDDFLSKLSFAVDMKVNYGLANGDKIKIFIDSKDVEKDAAENNYILTQTEKEYIVEGLPHYINLLSDIPADIADELQEKACEDVKTLLENNIMYREYTDVDIEFIGNYLWTIEGVSPTYKNYYYFIYKVNAILDQEKVAFYYYICFHDLFMDENGNLLVDLEQSGSGLDITEPHPGYETIEALENYLTECYGDTHTCDCNIK